MSERKNPLEVSNWIAVAVGLILIILLIGGVTRLAWWFYRILWYAAIPLLVITAFLDFQMVRNHFNWIISWVKKLYQRNEILGVATGIFSLVGLPISAAFLAVRAFTRRKVEREFQQENQTESLQSPDIGEYINFEEIEEKKEKERRQRRIGRNEYDDLFDK